MIKLVTNFHLGKIVPSSNIKKYLICKRIIEVFEADAEQLYG